MQVLARKRGDTVRPSTYLDVHSTVFGALHLTDSIRVYDGKGQLVARYKTVTDFFAAWEVVHADTHHIRLPWLRRDIGLGDVVRFFAELFPLWVKRWFHGCEDRRAWLNLWLVFTGSTAPNVL